MNNYELDNMFKTEPKKEYKVATDKQKAFIINELKKVFETLTLTQPISWGIVYFDCYFENKASAKRVSINFEILRRDGKVIINLQNNLLSWIAHAFIDFNGNLEIQHFTEPKTYSAIKKAYVKNETRI